MLKIYVTIILLAGGTKLAFAQKMITINDSLVANTKMFPVAFVKSKGFNAFQKLTFGDCTVVSGKLGNPRGNESSNIFGTKNKDRSSRKFSFVLADTARDTVTVTGIMKTVTETISPLQLSKSFSVGSDVQKESLDFSANVVAAWDTTHWRLSMKTESGGEQVKYEAFLTDGKRIILITPLYTSQYELPAFGYEFTENGQFYSAYVFSRDKQTNKEGYRIFFENGLTAKTKMKLSGAMVALLDLKNTN